MKKLAETWTFSFWGKKNPIPTCNNKYLSDLEYVVFAHEKGVAIFGNYKTKSKFYISETNKDDKSDFKHPTIKPLPFIKNMVENSSERGGLVLDPFAGSGTTAVAAKMLNRHFIGFEIEPKYFKIATDRVDGITKKERESGYQQMKLF